MWEKKGHLFTPNGSLAFSQSHAQVPVVLPLGDRLRIYYSTRDALGKSHICFIEVSARDPQEILYQHDQSILPFGLPGTFDDSGVMPSCVIQRGDQIWMYYIGWTVRGTVPYHNAVGLAISHDGGVHFERAYQGPIITVNANEPYFSGTSFVMKLDHQWRMYYLSCIGWKSFDNKYEPFYHIKMATSHDGEVWQQNGEVAIDIEGDEGGIVSASIVRHNDLYHMWYGVRKGTDYRTNTTNTYRIGYAFSQDGVHWQRQDDATGIDLSAEGWDSEMISYPYVIHHNNRLLLFYNGNGFGKTGFGYAQHNI
jgi:sucrose-6-phosphate hydrolase SacC (GH32 family)